MGNVARPLQLWELQMVVHHGRVVAQICHKVVLCRKKPIQRFSTREKAGRDATTWLQFVNLEGLLSRPPTIRSSTMVKMHAPKGLRFYLKVNVARPLQLWELQMVVHHGRVVAQLCHKVVLCRKKPIQKFSTQEKAVWVATTWLQFVNLEGPLSRPPVCKSVLVNDIPL